MSLHSQAYRDYSRSDFVGERSSADRARLSSCSKAWADVRDDDTQDMDGTLCDSTPAVESFLGKWAEKNGIEREVFFAVSHGVRTRDK